MKCHNCGCTQFRKSVTLKIDAEAVFDKDGKFCDFVGDLNDLANESSIIEREETFTCADCEMEYDPDEDTDDDDTDGESGDYDHDSIEECQEAGDHLTDVDDNGCCTFCGEQEGGEYEDETTATQEST